MDLMTNNSLHEYDYGLVIFFDDFYLQFIYLFKDREYFQKISNNINGEKNHFRQLLLGGFSYFPSSKCRVMAQNPKKTNPSQK